jgi:ferric-dicitrate binding protein FerR (iron transport regulator)
MTEPQSSNADEEAVRLAAADWFARLRGDPTDAERAEFAAWRSSDPRHGEAYDRMVRQWDQAKFIGAGELARNRDLSLAVPGTGAPPYVTAPSPRWWRS